MSTILAISDCLVSPVVPEDHRDALILRQRGEHVPELTRIAGQACGWLRWVQCHHPAPPQCRSASADDGAAQVGAGLADLVQPSRDLDETVLDEILGFGVATDEGVRETNHAGVLRPVEAFEHPGVIGDRLGRGSHFPHHPLRRPTRRKCCSPPQGFLADRHPTTPPTRRKSLELCRPDSLDRTITRRRLRITRRRPGPSTPVHPRAAICAVAPPRDASTPHRHAARGHPYRSPDSTAPPARYRPLQSERSRRRGARYRSSTGRLPTPNCVTQSARRRGACRRRGRRSPP